MRFIKQDTHIPFISFRYWFFAISGALILAGLTSIVARGGLNYGIDFAGGTLVQIKFFSPIPISKIRGALKDIDVGESIIQQVGAPEENEVLIRLEKSSGELEGLSAKLTDKFGEIFGPDKFEVRRTEMVGPRIGKELREKGFWAVIFALIGILAYVSIRFALRFSIAAVLALAHDVVITLGILSIFNKEITLSVLAALLTLAGYSINDTIVVFDRFRENIPELRRKSYLEILDLSLNQTLSRTLLTSVTTILVTLALLILGGEVIHDFAFTLTFGILVGTYSSVAIASPIVYIWQTISERRKKRPAPVATLKTSSPSKPASLSPTPNSRSPQLARSQVVAAAGSSSARAGAKAQARRRGRTKKRKK